MLSGSVNDFAEDRVHSAVSLKEPASSATNFSLFGESVGGHDQICNQQICVDLSWSEVLLPE